MSDNQITDMQDMPRFVAATLPVEFAFANKDECDQRVPHPPVSVPIHDL